MMLKHAKEAGEAGQRVRHTNQRRQTVVNENKVAALIAGTSSGITVTRPPLPFAEPTPKVVAST
jgi:hypothetical protein